MSRGGLPWGVGGSGLLVSRRLPFRVNFGSPTPTKSWSIEQKVSGSKTLRKYWTLSQLVGVGANSRGFTRVPILQFARIDRSTYEIGGGATGPIGYSGSVRARENN